MSKERWSILVVVGLVLFALVSGLSSAGLLGEESRADELVLLNDLAELQNDFNANQDKAQIILLVSPT